MDFQPSRYEIVIDKLNYDREFCAFLEKMGIPIPYNMVKKVLDSEEK